MDDRIVSIGTFWLELDSEAKTYVEVHFRAAIRPDHLCLMLFTALNYEEESLFREAELAWSESERSSDPVFDVQQTVRQGWEMMGLTFEEAKPQQIEGTPFVLYCYRHASSLRILFYRDDEPLILGQFEVFACADHRIQFSCKGNIEFVSAPLSP